MPPDVPSYGGEGHRGGAPPVEMGEPSAPSQEDGAPGEEQSCSANLPQPPQDENHDFFKIDGICLFDHTDISLENEIDKPVSHEGHPLKNDFLRASDPPTMGDPIKGGLCSTGPPLTVENDHTCGKFFGNSQKNAAKTLQEKVTPNSLKLVTPTMIM